LNVYRATPQWKYCTGASTLKKIVRRAVLLEYDHHMLKGSWELMIFAIARLSPDRVSRKQAKRGC
jgi:hypothetical protein